MGINKYRNVPAYPSMYSTTRPSPQYLTLSLIMQLNANKFIALVAVLSATSTDASQLIEREVR